MNPQPPVLETGALPIELLPLGVLARPADLSLAPRVGARLAIRAARACRHPAQLAGSHHGPLRPAPSTMPDQSVTMPTAEGSKPKMRLAHPIDADTESLVTAAKGGDDDAFGELVRRTHTDTFTLARRLVSNDDDASDVVQEAYLRAYRSIGRFRGDAQFSTWMYRTPPTAPRPTWAAGGAIARPTRSWMWLIPSRRTTRSPPPMRSCCAAQLEGESPVVRAVVVLRDITTWTMPR